ncbi:aldehyde dehydrogenase [Pseudohalioglobus sediminis]|uniref:Aldehyde dehydrogenase n=1 Tax=Pseudohalioglobus sediminis TaxID=2606449 RepID=A0A5B0X507_9GAMM|nr:aldehyde dehydrogenase [Pseudohalioglobus sediminis]
MPKPLTENTAVHKSTLPEPLAYIDDRASRPAQVRKQTLRNPNTLEPLQPLHACDDAQAESALAAAARAHETAVWENTPTSERAALLEAVADALDAPEVQETIAEVDALTTGAVISLTRNMARLAPLSFRAAAQYLREGNLEQRLPGRHGEVEYFRRPWGPAMLISPWNGPTAIGCHKIASALAAGAPCIAKPSEWTPHSSVVVAEAIARAGLPPGTFQLLLGNRETAGKLLGDPRIKAISFTGGTEGGRAVSAASVNSFRPLQLELGGNNPLVVFADADLDQAAAGIAFGLSNLNAQWCRALGRVIVHREVKQALLEKVQHALAGIRMGHSLDPDAEMGPQIHRQQFDSVQRHIQRLRAAGGELLQSTTLPDLPGYFIPPTLVDGCDPGQTRVEMFGPVAAVHSFDTSAEALALANGTDYGLAAYVYSGDEQAAFDFSRKLRTGGVKINGYDLLSLSPTAPRAAWGMSGLGEEGTGHSIEFFTGARVVGLVARGPAQN